MIAIGKNSRNVCVNNCENKYTGKKKTKCFSYRKDSSIVWREAERTTWQPVGRRNMAQQDRILFLARKQLRSAFWLLTLLISVFIPVEYIESRVSIDHHKFRGQKKRKSKSFVIFRATFSFYTRGIIIATLLIFLLQFHVERAGIDVSKMEETRERGRERDGKNAKRTK